MDAKDSFRTIKKSSEGALFKDKNSKFLGYAYPVLTEEEAKNHLSHLKKQHHTARHWCYAYLIGTDEKNRIQRVNDDGEPNNSAGAPIFGQIQSFDLTNVLIVVVRYFGGIKLGVSGLINAYRSAAKLALEQAEIIEKTINTEYCISFAYKDMNRVMRIIKENRLRVLKQDLTMDCKLYISVRQRDAQKIYQIFNNLFEVNIDVIG